jgi:hypothetical protein
MKRRFCLTLDLKDDPLLIAECRQPLPWLSALPWFRRDENMQPLGGIGATIGQRMARMYAPPAAPAPSAAPMAPMPFDPSKLPDGIRPQPDEREDGEYE